MPQSDRPCQGSHGVPAKNIAEKRRVERKWRAVEKSQHNDEDKKRRAVFNDTE